MGDIGDKFILLLSTNILSMAILGLFWKSCCKMYMCATDYMFIMTLDVFFFWLLYKDVSLHLDFLIY